jgi:hypothetical protein
MTWTTIKSFEDLPPEGKYVLARHSRGTWRDNTDQENVNCVVVKLVKGISLEERKLMEQGAIPCPKENGYERWKLYMKCDEHSNNLVPYNWEMFGPDSFFGQDIVEWTPIDQGSH